tara:strand:+ start:14265 stop:15206 length:942 start_codon:yes stop_codon:yes gene_type:complete
MCGLIGYNGKDGQKANPEILRKLMKANDSRGGHSTGYFDGTSMNKVLGKSDTLPMPNDTDMFIGHTRYATHGKKSVANQHPFQYGNVVGAHNGVVHNYREVGEKFGIEETEVDSQMIFELLSKKGRLDSLGKFTGALATLFTMDDKYYTYRKTNPLWVGRDKKGGVYFSSLRDVMIKECKLDNVFQLKEGRVYVWENGQVIAKYDIEHDPIAEKYRVQKKQWFEYGNANYESKPLRTYKKGVYSGITDSFDNSSKFVDSNELNLYLDSTDEDRINADVDITNYELTDNQDQMNLFSRCQCQETSADLCWCYTD